MTALVRVRLWQEPAAIAKAMRALDEMEQDLNKAETFQDVQKIQRKAEGLKALFRNYKNVSDRAGEIRINADVVIGKKLLELPRAKGAQTIGRNKTLRPTDDAFSYAENGLCQSDARISAARHCNDP
jgi:hypothetical protein